MSDPILRPSKRTAEEAGFHNHDTVHNQAINQTNHGSLYFGNVNIYNGTPVPGSDRSATTVDPDMLASLAFPGMLNRRHEIADPHQNTCEWIFDLEEYRNWAESSRGLLWIKGKPGSGKSTLMAVLHQKLRTQGDISHVIHLDFFFSARASELQCTPLGMLRSLLNQLLRKCPTVGSAVAASYHEKNDAFGCVKQNWEWQQPELERLLSTALIASSQTNQVVVFIDALDEAGEQAASHVARYIHNINDQVTTLGNTSTDLGLKFCLSSRHYLIVSTVQGTEICVEHHNHKDIAKFIHDELSLDLSNPDEVCDLDAWRELEHDVLSRARGIFQWVRAVLPTVSSGLKNGWSPEDVRELLQNQDLADIYTRILSHVIDKQHLSQSLLLFQWVHFAQRPLSAVEIMYALASSKHTLRAPLLRLNENIMKKKINSLSGGLIEIVYRAHTDDSETGLEGENHTVQVIHQTVREYLSKSGLQLLLHLSKGHHLSLPLQSEFDYTVLVQRSHSALYWCCLNYLASLDLEALMSITRKYTSMSNYRSRTKMVRKHLLSNLVFSDYVVQNMFRHAQEASVHRCIEEFQSQNRQQEFKLLERIRQCWTMLSPVLYPYSGVWVHTDWTLLHIASAFGLSDLAQDLIDGKHMIDSYDNRGWTPFHLASQHGHRDICEMLLQAGAYIDPINANGDTPVVAAASRGHAALVSWLVSNGAEMGFLNDKGDSPLIAAARTGKCDVVKVLVEAGADIDGRQRNDETPLQVASGFCQTHVVRTLIDAGADVNAGGGFYGTALEMAAYHEQTPFPIVRMLLEAGADVNGGRGYYNNALLAAVVRMSTRDKNILVRILLDAGADVNAQGGHFGTALKAATTSATRSKHIAQILIEAGAK